jgi:ATP-dependent Clp protease ATP-binding subunit ClpC
MNYSDLEKSCRIYYPAFRLDSLIGRSTRIITRKIFGWFLILLTFVDVIIFVIGNDRYLQLFVGNGSALSNLINSQSEMLGWTSIVLFVWLILFIFELSYNHLYFKGISSLLPERGLTNRAKVSFELAEVIYNSDKSNITKGFISSRSGKWILSRLGISRDKIKTFLKSQSTPIPYQNFVLNETAFVDLCGYVGSLLAVDQNFAKFLLSFGVQEKEVLGVAVWFQNIAYKIKKQERWWGKDNLAKLGSIGADWSYGKTFALQRYGADILLTNNSNFSETNNLHDEEVVAVEQVLSKSHEANALLVGEAGSDTMDVVYRFACRVASKTIADALKDKRVVLLDTELLIAESKEKSVFEISLIKILTESLVAGNIILVIKSLPSFVLDAKSIGSDVVAVMDPYISSSGMQVIAISDTSRFHQFIETNALLMGLFEKINVKETDNTSALSLLEDEIFRFEKQNNVFITYPALVEIVKSAGRYFSENTTADKVMDLLAECAPVALRSGKTVIEKSDILLLVEGKTGIPVGEIRIDEQEKLLKLEDILHERIVGQEEAVKAISNAVRRGRVGLENSNRPIGSFLFLGPTGVGKTETTKALSEAFFGKDVSVMRLDMSEYHSYDALPKFLGSFEEGRSGVLTSMLREHPYGVLLLDEFEKASQEVINLFLQILDEGIFSDAIGKKVNARNCIIIATSNAGSDTIWETVKNGENLADKKDEIINDLVKEGIFKPELLNRFDGVILFHPLSEDNLKKIAVLMLKKLQGRLGEKGVELVVNDALIKFLVKQGSDPKFGARPINRAIQEKVEEIIAEKMIKGEISGGSKIELTESELI